MWDQGNSSIVVFFSDSGTTCFQHVSPLTLLLTPGITQFVFKDERCEVSVLRQQRRQRKSEEGRVVTAGGGGGVRVVVCEGSSELPLPLLL